MDSSHQLRDTHSTRNLPREPQPDNHSDHNQDAKSDRSPGNHRLPSQGDLLSSQIRKSFGMDPYELVQLGARHTEHHIMLMVDQALEAVLHATETAGF